MSSAFRSLFGLWLLALAVLSSSQLVLPTQRPFVPANRWALVIGVSGYSQAISPLRYAALDAKDVSNALQTDLGFSPENVRLLADKGVEPTSKNILDALDGLLGSRRLDKANLFVFYFSGHGVATPKGDFLLPIDAEKGRYEEQGVPVREVIRRIVGAGLKNVLFVADACRAGTENDFGEDLTVLCHQANIAVMLGCAPGRRSYEEPSLKHGVFTHFLLEGIRRPELRDVSGALWASRLGADLQPRVREYTEPKRGDYAQVPTLWGETTTLDVLLAAYPQPPVSDQAVKLFQSKAEKLDKRDYAAAMILYANALYEKDQTDETVEILKTVQALGELTPEARFTLATALESLGRTGESARTSAAFETMPPGFWHDLGLAGSASRTVAPEARVRAAMNLIGSTDSWIVDEMAADVVQRFAGDAQRKEAAERLAARAPTERGRLLGRSKVATYEGRWKDATTALRTALASPGEQPTNRVLYLAMLLPTKASKDPKALAAYYEGAKAQGLEGLGHLGKAQLAKDRGDAGVRVAELRAFLKGEVESGELLSAVKIAGVYSRELAPDIKAAALRFPYSWEARVTLCIARQFLGDTSAKGADALAADRYMDDPVSMLSSLFETMESILTEATLLGQMTPIDYASNLDYYFLNLRDEVPHFGYDGDLWLQLLRYGLFNERNAQVQGLAARWLKIDPAKAPGPLKPALMFLAMNRGDSATVKRVFRSGFDADERTDPNWFYACYLASQGRPEEAIETIRGIKPPSAEIVPRMFALETYLIAASGDKEAARRRIGPTKDIVEKAFNGLTWALLGDWKRAEPLLAAQAIRPDWTFLTVQEFALRKLDERYRATGRAVLARDLAFAAATSQPGNPLFDRYSFAAKPGVGGFAGKTSLQAKTIDDRDPNLEGRLTFEIAPTGEFVGGFASAKGERAKLRGKTDAMGNVRGTASFHGREFALTGKVAPATLYKSYPKFKTIGQVFQLVDGDGVRVLILGRP